MKVETFLDSLDFLRTVPELNSKDKTATSPAHLHKCRAIFEGLVSWKQNDGNHDDTVSTSLSNKQKSDKNNSKVKEKKKQISLSLLSQNQYVSTIGGSGDHIYKRFVFYTGYSDYDQPCILISIKPNSYETRKRKKKLMNKIDNKSKENTGQMTSSNSKVNPSSRNDHDTRIYALNHELIIKVIPPVPTDSVPWIGFVFEQVTMMIKLPPNSRRFRMKLEVGNKETLDVKEKDVTPKDDHLDIQNKEIIDKETIKDDKMDEGSDPMTILEIQMDTTKNVEANKEQSHDIKENVISEDMETVSDKEDDFTSLKEAGPGEVQTTSSQALLTKMTSKKRQKLDVSSSAFISFAILERFLKTMKSWIDYKPKTDIYYNRIGKQKYLAKHSSSFKSIKEWSNALDETWTQYNELVDLVIRNSKENTEEFKMDDKLVEELGMTIGKIVDLDQEPLDPFKEMLQKEGKEIKLRMGSNITKLIKKDPEQLINISNETKRINHESALLFKYIPFKVNTDQTTI